MGNIVAAADDIEVMGKTEPFHMATGPTGAAAGGNAQRQAHLPGILDPVSYAGKQRLPVDQLGIACSAPQPQRVAIHRPAGEDLQFTERIKQTKGADVLQPAVGGKALTKLREHFLP